MAAEVLNITDQAAAKVWELMQEDNKPDIKLRAYIEGGGCSGYQYGFIFTKEKTENDAEINKPVMLDGSVVGHVKLLVDEVSYTFLAGAEIDYKEDIEGARFIIRNPNAKTTCGCGSSFSV
jgi:iron-sulfur cluster insertion protein